MPIAHIEMIANFYPEGHSKNGTKYVERANQPTQINCVFPLQPPLSSGMIANSIKIYNIYIDHVTQG